jgi:hypothetical protein
MHQIFFEAIIFSSILIGEKHNSNILTEFMRLNIISSWILRYIHKTHTKKRTLIRTHSERTHIFISMNHKTALPLFHFNFFCHYIVCVVKFVFVHPHRMRAEWRMKLFSGFTFHVDSASKLGWVGEKLVAVALTI